MKTDAQPLVSIIVPAYNSEKTIQGTILSVLDQTYGNWELIVVNDGSRDNTSHVVSEIKDERIVLIEKENSGVAETRNLGIEKSKGEFIAFLDSDDLWSPEKLSRQVDVLVGEGNEVGLVHCDYLEFDHNKTSPRKLQHTSVNAVSGWVYDELAVYDFVGTLTVMVRREVLNEVGFFDVSLSGPEDWDLWIRISQKYRFAYINEPLAKYRLSPGGLSKNVASFEAQLQKLLEKHLLQSHLPKSRIKRGLWLHYRHMSHAYARGFDFTRAINRFSKAFRSSPFRLKNIESVIYISYNFCRAVFRK